MTESPCVKICALDRNNVCKGCGRTVAEIGAWTGLTDAQRAEIVAMARLRLRKMAIAAAAAQADAARRQPLGV